MKSLLTVEQLASFLNKSPSSIRCDASRKPHSLPPICRLPGTNRLLWRVRPISEDGKWIEFEYYHWLHQEYRTGWALKKYFQRVARPDSHSLTTSGQPEAQPPSPKSLTQLIGTAKGAFENAAEADAFVRAERDQWEH